MTTGRRQHYRKHGIIDIHLRLILNYFLAGRSKRLGNGRGSIIGAESLSEVDTFLSEASISGTETSDSITFSETDCIRFGGSS